MNPQLRLSFQTSSSESGSTVSNNEYTLHCDHRPGQITGSGRIWYSGTGNNQSVITSNIHCRKSENVFAYNFSHFRVVRS